MLQTRGHYVMLVASTPHHRSAVLALGFGAAAAAVCFVAGPA